MGGKGFGSFLLADWIRMMCFLLGCRSVVLLRRHVRLVSLGDSFILLSSIVWSDCYTRVLVRCKFYSLVNSKGDMKLTCLIDFTVERPILVSRRWVRRRSVSLGPTDCVCNLHKGNAKGNHQRVWHSAFPQPILYVIAVAVL